MRRRLPPFASLRAFEAVAQTLSFTRAAETLGVTQAAVSRQVKALEQDLARPLIRRGPGGNRLTGDGRRLLAALSEGLDRIEEGVRAVSGVGARQGLTVSVAPFFSAIWLTPRIMRFIAGNPGIDLRLHHAYQPPDFGRDQVDLGLNWGSGAWPGVTAEKFLDGRLVAVCSPDLMETLQGNGPEALLGLPLFYEFSLDDWRRWFSAHGLTLPQHPDATRIDDSHALRRMALEGAGVCLLFETLMSEDLATGLLVRPFDGVSESGSHYFLNYPSAIPLGAGAQRFRQWLLEERGNPERTEGS